MFFIFNFLKKQEKTSNLKSVAVFFGGKSTEHDVSVITGVLTLNSIDKTKFNPVAVYVSKDGTWYGGDGLNALGFYKNPDFKKLKRIYFSAGENELYYIKSGKIRTFLKLDAAILCMHGINGEDGTLCGLLRLCGVATVAPPLFAQAVAIDKDYTKLALKALDIPCVEYMRVMRDRFYEKKQATVDFCAKKLGFPLIVKPARLGSSIGVKVVYEKSELERAISAAFAFDDKVILEKFLSGARDVNAAAYACGGKINVSHPEQAISAHEILTFEDKYGGGKGGMASSKRETDFGISQEAKNKIREYCEKIYRKLDFSSIVRFDFLLYENEVYLNEINAIPGSMAYYFFCDKISDFSNLLTRLITEAERKLRRENNYITEFDSFVLSGDFSGAKK